MIMLYKSPLSDRLYDHPLYYRNTPILYHTFNKIFVFLLAPAGATVKQTKDKKIDRGKIFQATVKYNKSIQTV